MALAGFVTAGALPAAAAPSTIDYVALGDSYAAGTASQLGGCPHGPDAYPVLLAGSDESRIDLTANVACSGATTSYVVEHELSALERDTRLVTLTVGAANLGLSTVAGACLTGTLGDCLAAIGPAQRELGDCGGVSPLGGDLTELYRDVAKAAPGARIVVTGYPLLFKSPLANDPRAAAINEATTTLNCVIKHAVAESQATYANIYYVDVTEEFAKHGIISLITYDGTFIHSLFTCDPPSQDCRDLEAFHPTAEGYDAYAKAIKSKLPSGWLGKPSST
jgi:lysophospholipase L1-like esterase